ncbi:helix-turn-helix domain-containing protein [Streptomyces sp. NBC_00658]|uniref:nSTAND1 domain-containing NTPase n=1 Tax=Streptomyces sp. NBC_00658 TaxID=2975800 RepID=UPI00324D91C3
MSFLDNKFARLNGLALLARVAVAGVTWTIAGERLFSGTSTSCADPAEGGWRMEPSHRERCNVHQEDRPQEETLREFQGALKTLLKNGGKTYRELAADLQYSKSAVSNWLNSPQLLALEECKRIAEYCGGSVEQWETHWRSVKRALNGSKNEKSSTCPYRGFAPYTEEDRPFFYGRSNLIEEAVESIHENRLLIISGPTGAGKTSLLRAGILARISTEHTLQGRWPHVLVTPSGRPMDRLAEKLARMYKKSVSDVTKALTGSPEGMRDFLEEVALDGIGGTQLLLAVDQWEEIYTSCEEGDRQYFVESLRLAMQCEIPRIKVVAVVQSHYRRRGQEDFKELLGGMPALTVHYMTSSEIDRAIKLPAAALGANWEECLINSIKSHVRKWPGALPWFLSVLEEEWIRRGVERDMSDFCCHEAEVLAKRKVFEAADIAYGGLTEKKSRFVLREILGKMSTHCKGHGWSDEKIFRQVSELSAKKAAAVEEFAKARLITIDGHYIEMGHEALIDWDPLRAWNQKHRQR